MSPEMALMLASFLKVVWWVIFARVILSWVIRDPANPIARFLSTLTDPLLAPLSRVMTFGGMDFSPMLVLFAIGALQRVLIGYAT